MYLKYGTYTHALDESSLVISKDTLLTDGNLPRAVRHRWQVSGLLIADSQAALTTAIAALEAAYAKPGQDATLLLDDGSTATAHKLVSSQAVGGVIVTQPPSYPLGTGAEYAAGHGRSYTLALEAEIPITGTYAIETLSWDETLTFSGGLPRYVHLELRNGPPQKQLVSQATTYRASQSGRAVGYRNYPSVPAPLWSDPLDRNVTRRVPKTTGLGSNRTLSEFEVSWNYSFESAFPLAGNPTQRPAR